MRETLASRVTRIVSGSLNALLDAVEQAAPEAAMAEAIREVERAIDEVRAELGKTLANKHLAVSNLARLNERHAELSAQIEVAVGKGEDDLSRAGIARQLDLEAQMPVLEKAIAEAAGQERELEGYLLALQARKRDMEESLNAFIASRAAPEQPVAAGGPAHGDAAGRAERAESAFGRILARETGLAAPRSEDSAALAGKLKELGELARGHRIDERLAALKAKQGK
jgi:phage shock protein A